MKYFIALLLTVCAVSAVQAIETICRGNTQDVVCYYQGGRFYADKARKECLYHHPGNMVAKDKTANAKNCLYRLMSDKLYKGFSINKADCIATIFEIKTSKGNTVLAKIYPGFVIVRDKVEKATKDGSEYTSFKVTRDGINPEEIPALFTIEGNKIYKGDSTKPEDCVLTFTGSFNSSRLLFMAIELTK